MQQFFSEAREVAHSAIAVIGVVAAAVGGAVTAVQAAGVSMPNSQDAQWLALAGGIAVLVSKLIDSANDAVTSTTAQG